MKLNQWNLFGTLLTILFIGLKLTHFIEWSWWWVFSPLWIPFAILAFVWSVLGLYYLIYYSYCRLKFGEEWTAHCKQRKAYDELKKSARALSPHFRIK